MLASMSPSPATGPPRKDSRQSIGAAAEELAAAYLSARGLTLLARNVRCRAGEIDLVCQEGELLVMVEVRLRAGAGFGGALASVTPAKRRKLRRAARFALQHHPAWRARRMRFDVVGLQGSAPDELAITWIKDAFR
jgi:putative endonuclease